MKNVLRFFLYPLLIFIIVSSTLMFLTHESRTKSRPTVYDESSIVKELTLFFPNGNQKVIHTYYIKVEPDNRCTWTDDTGKKHFFVGTLTIKELD